jgi:Abortive infection C-terminus
MVVQVNSRIPPITDSTVAVISRMVDDHAAAEKREPTHSQLESLVARAGLADYDPGRDRGRPIGKEKRLRAVLNAALADQPASGGRLQGLVIAEIRGCGGFRTSSPNFIGHAVIEDARVVFAAEGWALESDGELRPMLLDRLDGLEARAALRSYVRRIRLGSEDDALVLGTSKDLLEATAAHVVTERFGGYNGTANFPTLLGQAFVAVGLATPAGPSDSNEQASAALERSLYELGCAVNRLRNREGSGHGRPFLPSISPRDAKAAAAAMALVSETLLDALGELS